MTSLLYIMVGGKEVRRNVKHLEVGAYGLHLALDTMEGGLIDSFAHVFSGEFRRYAPEMDARGGKVIRESYKGMTAVEEAQHQPVDLTYKGVTVAKGAVCANISVFTGMTYGYGIPAMRSPTPEEVALKFVQKYRRKLPAKDFEIMNNTPGKGHEKAVIATGPAIRKDFLEQVDGIAQLFIAGSIKDDARDYAHKTGISLVALGDFASHYPGMTRFTHRLGGLLKQRDLQLDGEGIETVFIPNYSLQETGGSSKSGNEHTEGMGTLSKIGTNTRFLHHLITEKDLPYFFV